MEVVKLKAVTKDYIWGGDTLIKWGKDHEGDVVAESWELSFSSFGPSIIDSGINKEKLLKDVASSQDLGKHLSSFSCFPLLIKLIDAKNNLSVQVHPSDEYALKNENSLGKTEMWYVIASQENAGLYVGFNKKITKEEVTERISNNTLIEVLNFIKVKPGDAYFIPAGTIHAIGAGVTILEVQQNSNVTYRIYDYGRIDKNGKPRDLHISQALDVLNLEPYENIKEKHPLLAKCSYFSTYEYKVDEHSLIVNDDKSFSSITFIDGEGVIENIPYKRGDTFFIPANKSAFIDGNGTYILSKID